MALPSFNAEQSLYRSCRHYRSSTFASVVGGIRPSDNLPPGSYQRSCYDCYSDGYNLSCFCATGGGSCGAYNYAGLGPISGCRGRDIVNRYGTLTC
jgi:hypothetical protein